MRNKTLPFIAKVFGFIVAMMLMHSSQALQITMNVPDCPAGQTLGFSSNTLSCTGTVAVVNTPNNCSVTSSPATTAATGVQPGTNVTLTANCSGGRTPHTHSWNIGVVGIAQLTVAPGATTTYTVTPSNADGIGTPFSTTVYVGNNTVVAGTTVPTGCAITQSAVGPVNSGVQVTLQMTCSGGSPVTGCSWSNAINSNACLVAVQPSVSTTYTANASNSGGVSSGATATVSIVPIAGGGNGVPTPPVVAAQDYCTNSNDQIISVPWPSLGQSKQSTRGFGNGRIAFKFVIPTSFNPELNINHVGLLRLAEIPGSAVVTRDYTVSKSPCDFQSNSYIYSGIGASDTAPTLSFTANNQLGYLATGAAMNFNSGDTVYLNIRNYAGSTPTCPYSSCDILLDVRTPNAY